MDLWILYKDIKNNRKSVKVWMTATLFLAFLIVAFVQTLAPLFFEYKVLKDDSVNKTQHNEVIEQSKKTLRILEDIKNNTDTIIVQNSKKTKNITTISSTTKIIVNKPKEADKLAFKHEQKAHKNLLPRKAKNTSTINTGQSINIFEGTEFDLCGYHRFQAYVIDKSGSAASVRINSEDRTIPNRTFRGYSKNIFINTNVELWPNCIVTISYQTLASTTRITIKHLKEK